MRGETDQASYRGGVDNRTSTMLLHLEDLRFHAEPDTLEVDGDDRIQSSSV